jgi:hypothetical protein
VQGDPGKERGQLGPVSLVYEGVQIDLGVLDDLQELGDVNPRSDAPSGDRRRVNDDP